MRKQVLSALLLVLLLCTPALGGGTVSGVVVGQSGPLAGVRVEALESGQSAVTGKDGRFTLAISSAGTTTLRFSHAGYKTLTRHMEEAATDVIVSLKVQP
ncbi:MAG: carboxypeptidase regulatory-like domain-containing protein [Desulfovibrio sp.]